MDNTGMQQIWQRLAAEERVLLALPTQPSHDAIASALALSLVLKQLKKKPTIVAHAFHFPSELEFLHDRESIQPALETKKHFVITVDISKTSIEELSYDVRGDALQIFLTPKDGRLSASDLTTSGGDPDHTLIITLGAPDLAALGPLFEQHTHFFYGTPILNIDHHSENTEFGHFNLVDLTAAAIAETVYDLIKSNDAALLTEPVATSLLTGIISNTRVFHSPVVTPKTLSAASALIAAGARREDILRRLYQSKPVATLRLWGRVLARVQAEADGRALLSRLRVEDFTKAGASADAIPGVLDELLHASSRAEIVAVLLEKSAREVEGVAHARPSIDLSQIFRGMKIKREGTTARLLFSGENLEQAERNVRETIRSHYHTS